MKLTPSLLYLLSQLEIPTNRYGDGGHNAAVSASAILLHFILTHAIKSERVIRGRLWTELVSASSQRALRRSIMPEYHANT